MKTRTSFFTIALMGLFLIPVSLPESAAGPLDETDPENEKTAFNGECQEITGRVTDRDAEGLLFMWEEEKMAKDVYTFFNEKYNHRIFGNINKSEAMHQSAINRLMEGFAITRQGSDTPGVFNNKQIGELYNTLIERGEKSFIEALKAGALIEETDILDLKTWLNETENPFITRVYSNLLRASENHLRAFTGVLKIQEIIYEPEILNDDYYFAILNRHVPGEFREKGYYAGR